MSIATRRLAWMTFVGRVGRTIEEKRHSARRMDCVFKQVRKGQNTMDQEIQKAWQQLQEQISASQFQVTLPIGLYLAIGGILAMYLRFLYNRFSRSASDSETLSRVLPLLTLATIAVIAVVKSSVALSLGLVGALSIVRFRAAIKDPEELVYLFLCIGVGLALGAEQPLLALILVAVATVFILGLHLLGTNRRRHHLLLTVTGDTNKYFDQPGTGVVPAVEELIGKSTLQRMEIGGERSQARFAVPSRNPAEVAGAIAKLRERLPECEFSYVNLSSSL